MKKDAAISRKFVKIEYENVDRAEVWPEALKLIFLHFACDSDLQGGRFRKGNVAPACAWRRTHPPPSLQEGDPQSSRTVSASPPQTRLPLTVRVDFY